MGSSQTVTPGQLGRSMEQMSATALQSPPAIREASSFLPSAGTLTVPSDIGTVSGAWNQSHSTTPDLSSRSRLAGEGDYRRMRVLLWTTDGATAMAVAASTWLLNNPYAVLVPILWGTMMAVRKTREGRIADLVDLSPYTKANVNFLLLVALSVSLSSDLRVIRTVLVMSTAMYALGWVTRWGLGRAAVRRRLGLDIGETVVVVGKLESVSRTIREWEGLRFVRIVGACLSESEVGPKDVLGVPVLGSVGDIAAITRRMSVDVVAVHDVDRLGGQQLAKLQWALEDVRTQISIVTPMTNTGLHRTRVRTIGRRLTVDIARGRPQGVVAASKGVVDRVVGLVLLVIALPVIAGCAALILAASPGPVIFRQTRVREHGRTFTMYKLRTMCQDAEARLADLAALNEVGGGMFKVKADPRVTPIGKRLRQLSLDELPQLWNVVLGDMSLIGPRPALPSEVESYDDAARRRLVVKPGLTGLWQVSGRSNLSWDETVRIDSRYIDNWRPSQDLSIALRTVKTVLTKDGAH